MVPFATGRSKCSFCETTVGNILRKSHFFKNEAGILSLKSNDLFLCETLFIESRHAFERAHSTYNKNYSSILVYSRQQEVCRVYLDFILSAILHLKIVVLTFYFFSQQQGQKTKQFRKAAKIGKDSSAFEVFGAIEFSKNVRLGFLGSFRHDN